jgi:hypothetical protein
MLKKAYRMLLASFHARSILARFVERGKIQGRQEAGLYPPPVFKRNIINLP